ncbi:MAG: hypothetical protein H6743_03720 [Rickettsiaceae bacterium]|nr:hypothetical protein [Rickettsiaceae bacterium]
MALRDTNTGQYIVYKDTNFENGLFTIYIYENQDHRNAGDNDFRHFVEKNILFNKDNFKSFLDDYPYNEDRTFRLNMVTAAYDYMMTRMENIDGYNVSDLEDVLADDQAPSIFRGI